MKQMTKEKKDYAERLAKKIENAMTGWGSGGKSHQPNRLTPTDQLPATICGHLVRSLTESSNDYSKRTGVFLNAILTDGLLTFILSQKTLNDLFVLAKLTTVNDKKYNSLVLGWREEGLIRCAVPSNKADSLQKRTAPTFEPELADLRQEIHEQMGTHELRRQRTRLLEGTSKRSGARIDPTDFLPIHEGFPDPFSMELRPCVDTGLASQDWLRQPSGLPYDQASPWQIKIGERHFIEGTLRDPLAAICFGRLGETCTNDYRRAQSATSMAESERKRWETVLLASYQQLDLVTLIDDRDLHAETLLDSLCEVLRAPALADLRADLSERNKPVFEDILAAYVVESLRSWLNRTLTELRLEQLGKAGLEQQSPERPVDVVAHY